MDAINLYKELTAHLVRFKTISTDPQSAGEIKKCVEFLSGIFKNHGFTVDIWQGKSTNPVVFASVQVDPQFETVLVYGHYDVQPASADGWDSDPWTLTERYGRLFARGAIDNKGQVAIHIATVFDLLELGQLGYNVKFLLEGNEETANDDLAGLIAEHKDQLAADTILISDGEIHGDQPSIEASLRGGMNVALRLTTANMDLHSGIYGGSVPNAAHELITLLAALFDARGKFLVSGFYDNVDDLTELQQKHIDVSQHESIKQMTGVKQLLVDEGLDAHIQSGLKPTVEITGLESGYTAQGFANIVPHTAQVKLNFRLVASQRPEEILQQFTEFVQQAIPSYVDLRIEVTGVHTPVKVSLEGQKVRLAQQLLHKVYGQEAAIRYVGGGIPVVTDFQEKLGVESLLIPLVNEDCHMHGANENFKLDLVDRALTFSHEFFKK